MFGLKGKDHTNGKRVLRQHISDAEILPVEPFLGFLGSVFWPKCSFGAPFHHYFMGEQTAGWLESQQALLLFGRPLPGGKDGDKHRG